MTTKLPPITLTPLQVSDLFFNASHPRYDRLLSGDEHYSGDEARAALRADAVEFIESAALDLNPDELVEDFFARL